MRIPTDHPVRPLRRNTKAFEQAEERRTCGTCNRSWDDAIATAWTPAPSGRCPFETFH